jgi:hypothetical protein
MEGADIHRWPSLARSSTEVPYHGLGERRFSCDREKGLEACAKGLSSALISDIARIDVKVFQSRNSHNMWCYG